jgi:hypothetical protein
MRRMTMREIAIYDLAVHVMNESFKWERVEG